MQQESKISADKLCKARKAYLAGFTLELEAVKRVVLEREERMKQLIDQPSDRVGQRCDHVDQFHAELDRSNAEIDQLWAKLDQFDAQFAQSWVRFDESRVRFDQSMSRFAERNERLKRMELNNLLCVARPSKSKPVIKSGSLPDSGTPTGELPATAGDLKEHLDEGLSDLLMDYDVVDSSEIPHEAKAECKLETEKAANCLLS
ncbi:unnamed protein product [Rhizoctonia solani]|uniref:Uncharacterized protein n=1 Tax=Rhizoctonia solani TaxID=456999 RepID=A0A8H2XRC7_9AGAM|nr:unnamed protein product [Rhizoctonia solani]